MKAVSAPEDRHGQSGPGDSETVASSRRVYFAPILTLALLLRLAVALAMAKHGQNGWFFAQATELGCLAQSVLAGHGLASPFGGATGPSAFLAPGYPLFVAAVFRLFGEYSRGSLAAIVGCQIVFGLLSVLTLMLLTRRVLGCRAANFAGLACAISPTMIWLPVLFWETSLSILFLTGALTLAIHCVDRPTRRNWAAMGLLCALAMQVNPALTLTLFAVFAWSAWMSIKSKAALAGPIFALALCTVAFSVWPARNWLTLHAFVPLRSNLGYELWQGNRPGSDGEFSSSLHPNNNLVERARYAKLGELEYVREKSALATAAIEGNPARFVRLSAQRVVQFWTGFSSRKSPSILIVNVCATTVLAVIGLVLLARRRPSYAVLLALPFLLFPLPYYVTHADVRFRLLLDPIAIMLGTYALQCLHRHAVRQFSRSTHMTATAAQSFT